MARHFSLRGVRAVEPIEAIAMRNLFPQPRTEEPPPEANEDIYGDLEPAYRAILLKRLQRYLSAPREIPPARNFVE